MHRFARFDNVPVGYHEGLMRRAFNPVTAVFGLLLCLFHVPAAGAEDLQAANVSRAAMDVFAEVCVEKLADQGAMDAWLGAHLFRQAAPRVAAQMSMGDPGRVWLSGEAEVPFAVITRTAGVLCQVMAPIADPEVMAALFRDSISALAEQGRVVRKDEDADVTIDRQAGHREVFRVGGSQGGESVYVLSVTLPRPGGVALLMTASLGGP
jgi:hypothetical protein